MKSLLRGAVLGFVLVLMAGAPSSGQERSPFPPFTGARVYTVGVADSFGNLDPLIRKLEKASPQTYYVVVVKSFGKGSNASVEYVDELYGTWRRQADQKRLALDDARSVVTAIALADRKLAVHPGSTLRDRLGFRGATIDRELIEPRFIPLAKQDHYPQAIAALLEGMSDWIAARERMIASATAKPAAPPAPHVPRPVEYAPSTTHPSVFVPSTPPATESQGHPVLTGLLVLALAAAAAMGIGVWRRRHQARIDLERRVKDYRARSVEVMDRLDALKDRIKLLTASDPDFKAPLLGETLKLWTSLQADVETLWDRWLAAMEALEKGQKLAAKVGSSFDAKTLKQVQATLDPKTAFDPIEQGAIACKADLERLDQSHERARDVAQKIEATAPQLAAGLESVRQLGLPITSFQEELENVKAEAARLAAGLTADPIGTKPALDALAERSTDLGSKVEHMIALQGAWTKASARLEQVKKQTAEHRARGLALAEDGGNPDHFLGEAADHLAMVESALHDGDPDKGQRVLEQAVAMLDQGAATIEEVKKAKAFCALELAARPRETERLRAAAPEAEASLKRLEQEFAASSWRAVAKNLDQARALLATFEDQLAKAAKAQSPDAQRYLAGRRALEELARQQQIVLRLLAGLGEQLGLLQTARDECQPLKRALDERTRAVQSLFQANAEILGEIALASQARATTAAREIDAGMDDPRPDWPGVRERLMRAIEDLKIASSQAEADLATHAQLLAEFEPARQRAGQLRGRLASRQEDRLAANQNFQAAENVLDQVGVDLAAPHGQSARMLEAVRGAIQDLDRAEQLFREDLRLAAQAQSEIDEAARSLLKASAYFALGVTPEGSSAEAALNEAQQLLANQDYEQAIERAGAAIQMTRHAYNMAVQETTWRHMRQQAEMARWQGGPGWGGGLSVGTVAAVAAAATILDQMPGSASAGAAPSPAPPPDSGSAASSWSSNDGQGSW